MLDVKEHQTQMYREAAEAHQRVKAQLGLNAELQDELGQKFRQAAPAYVMICARGSSSHAGLYARYLIETRLSIPVMPVAPSVSSIFSVRRSLENVLFLAISQSGQSPDIITAAESAKMGGATLVSLVNDTNSPLAQISDVVIPIHAGEEKSVAATKTFICTLSAIAHLVAHWAENKPLIYSLNELPHALEQAFDLTWEDAIEALETPQSLFVISRGLGLSIAKEAALKFKETCCVHAEAFSAAEVKHGPMALVKNGFPAFIFSTGDEAQASIDDVAHAFISRSAKIFATAQPYKGGILLPTINSPKPELTPIITIQSFYRFINALSLKRGFNPDAPEYLNKVTETL